MRISWKKRERSSRHSRLISGAGPTSPRGHTSFTNPLRESLKRLLLLKISMLLFFLAVGARLVQIQLIDSPTYQELARKQYEAKVIVPATRGNIYDRNGKILVSNAMYVSFAADPKMMGKDAPAIAKRFAQAFGKPASTYLEKLATPNKHFVWLERRVKPEIAESIDPNDFEGVIKLNEPKRVYHYGHVGGQLIGFTDVDNNGLSGIELEFDQHLRGTNGYVVMQRDGLGRKRPSVDYPRVDPVNGNSLVLTIDLDYQSIAEEEIRKGVERNKAESGLIVMMDPVSGEILAMANYPTIDPNNISRTGQMQMKNRAVADMFEPGSVFKVVTASAALERHLVKPEQRFSAEHGTYVVNLPGGKKRVITDTHEYAVLTFQEAMENSSNIVMAKVSDVIGAEVFYTMARNFGFGIATGVDLPGEVGGELKKPNTWSGITLNSMAYGYEVGVTPLQIAAA
jgi:cell division protein FtsI (penicillin-binding protein 3)